MLILTLVRPDLSLSSLQLKTKGFGSKDKTMCSFWLNTSFLEDGITVLSKPEIDKCHQDMKKHAKFDRNFQITLRHTDKEPEDFRERATGGPRRRALGAPSQAMPTFDVEESGPGTGRSGASMDNPLADELSAAGGAAPASVVEI